MAHRRSAAGWRSAVAGAGTVSFSSGTATITGTYNVAGATAVGGTANFASPVASVGSTVTVGGVLNLSTGQPVTVPTLALASGAGKSA